MLTGRAPMAPTSCRRQVRELGSLVAPMPGRRRRPRSPQPGCQGGSAGQHSPAVADLSASHPQGDLLAAAQARDEALPASLNLLVGLVVGDVTGLGVQHGLQAGPV
jgi:hypothetical protein